MQIYEKVNKNTCQQDNKFFGKIILQIAIKNPQFLTPN